MYICIFTYIYIHVYIYTYKYMYIYLSYIEMCQIINWHFRNHLFHKPPCNKVPSCKEPFQLSIRDTSYVWIYRYMYVYMQLDMYIYIYVYAHISIIHRISTYSYTHIYMYGQKQIGISKNNGGNVGFYRDHTYIPMIFGCTWNVSGMYRPRFMAIQHGWWLNCGWNGVPHFRQRCQFQKRLQFSHGQQNHQNPTLW